MFFIGRLRDGSALEKVDGQPMTDLQHPRLFNRRQLPRSRFHTVKMSTCQPCPPSLAFKNPKLADQPSSPVLVWGRSRWEGGHSRWEGGNGLVVHLAERRTTGGGQWHCHHLSLLLLTSANPPTFPLSSSQTTKN